jgi:predicted 3-demethylubiquinone-9 3-methyltransferase (glyoxalase superfamily)
MLPRQREHFLLKHCMNKVTPFLWFDNNAGEAMDFYTTVFKNSKIIAKQFIGDGVMLTGRIEIEGQELMFINGGPAYQLSPAISLFVDCKDQEEVDTLWNTFIESGGTPSRCGWLVDKFGLSWQIIPRSLMTLMNDPDKIKAGRVMQAMMKMVKISIADLEKAYNEA